MEDPVLTDLTRLLAKSPEERAQWLAEAPAGAVAALQEELEMKIASARKELSFLTKRTDEIGMVMAPFVELNVYLSSEARE